MREEEWSAARVEEGVMRGLEREEGKSSGDSLMYVCGGRARRCVGGGVKEEF
jgi:hypothetical protein